MNDTNLPATSETSLTGHYTLLVAKSVLEMLADRSRNAEAQRIMEAAIKITEADKHPTIHSSMFSDSSLVVQVVPKRQVVIVMSRYPGWPHGIERFIEELIPFCTSVSAP